MANPEGGKSGHGPRIEVGNGVWPPSGTERVMTTLRICRNVMILVPRIDVGYGFGPPTVKYRIKTLKRSMTKKGHQKFWEIDDIFLEKC